MTTCCPLAPYLLVISLRVWCDAFCMYGTISTLNLANKPRSPPATAAYSMKSNFCSELWPPFLIAPTSPVILASFWYKFRGFSAWASCFCSLIVTSLKQPHAVVAFIKWCSNEVVGPRHLVNYFDASSSFCFCSTSFRSDGSASIDNVTSTDD